MATPRSKKRPAIVRAFAAKLREVRLSRGMTQAELARQADISPTYISEMENADTTPGIDVIERLARALGVSPAELLVTAATDPLPVLREQARRMVEVLVKDGDRETLLKLNPLLALLVEELARRG